MIMLRRNIVRLNILLIAFLLPVTLFSQSGAKIKTVVIDAGHGGTDPGAVNKTYKFKEKDVTLAVAKATGDLIKKTHPDVKVIYTRDKDVFVELVQRAKIANDNKADFFISIHCNAASDTKAYGTETWVLGDSKSSANLDVVKRENDVIKQEKNSGQYNAFLDSPEATLLMSHFQSLYLKQSLKLADNVQKQLLKRKGSKDRKVQQAGFLVLWKTAMPSILIELGFITNDSEGRYLASEAGQKELANSICKAFSEYKKAYEEENKVPSGGNTPAPVEEAPAVEDTVVEETAVVDTITEDPTAENVTEDPSVSTPEVKPEPTPEPKPDPKPKPKPETKPSQPKVSFKVQFFISDRKLSAKDKRISQIKEVDFYEYKGAFCYTSGNFQNKEKAFARQKEVQKQGYPDAWIVCFVDGKRVSMQEADKALENNK